MNDNITRILFQGCSGDDVKYVQYILGIEETGFYDKNTRLKIEDFQIKCGLDVTGELEPKYLIKLAHYCISSCTDESLDELEKDLPDIEKTIEK